ncbi:hypothetical protein ALT_0359 [Aspergillus lentulus]|uniref:Dolichyl-diphosphooligosaccharide--protein glycosyltransferase subunit 4 n=1 Tax=Aspergillus lentulus TaxID=293939 RepID=A0AAN5YQR4_ASPLE|nr:hypothetical protein CNMCM6069_006156 [Aspergillus lentulus]KAF4177031.1 hypothetical protein CNMCM8060_005799 [Aspergillus lentulus]KAF4185926.1 hypothetical protein CNMCM7927_006104 [Aspergillus lentulus]KAF4194323.1 hypothetical protein CNMCM8694_007709 [Aspergillus lentulus]KAF4205570.1 hypothetical protein CNMCM8927_006070 [Aspergillus lentulus]
MISDDDLYRLAIFLGSCAMMMIVLYHFLEVNAKDDTIEEVPGVKKSVEGSTTAGVTPAPAAAAAAAGGTSAIGGGKDR